MSSCIVAQYPWKAIRRLIGSEPPGVIICSDTRISYLGRDAKYHPFKELLAKQREYSSKLVVCYTSSHVYATTAALNKITKAKNVRQLGYVLKEAHQTYNGLTELIAVIRKKRKDAPEILAFMPQSYVPEPCSGIVAIGDELVARRFKETFQEVPPAYCPIYQAAGVIAVKFIDAIEHVQSATVALPIQITVINREGVTAVHGAAFNPDNTFTRTTAPYEELAIPANPPRQIIGPRDMRNLKVQKLFD